MGWSQFLADERTGATLSIPDAISIRELTIRDLALFLCVWVIYLFDRLYDRRKVPSSNIVPLRHQFAKDHLKLLTTLLGIGILSLVLLVPRLETSDWFLGLWVSAGVVSYFVLFRFAESFSATRRLVACFPAKETALAVFFSLGVMGAAERLPRTFPEIGECLTLGLSFALLVLSNCLLIAYAEQEHDRTFDSSSFFARHRPIGSKVILVIPGLTVVLALVFGWTFESWGPALAIVFSTLGLFLVHFSPTPVLYRQPLFDGVLLLPWIPMLISSLLVG